MKGQTVKLELDNLTSKQLIALGKLNLHYLQVFQVYTKVNDKMYSQIEVKNVIGVVARGPIVDLKDSNELWDLKLVEPDHCEKTKITIQPSIYDPDPLLTINKIQKHLETLNLSYNHAK